MREDSSEGSREGRMEDPKKAFKEIMVDGLPLLQGLRPDQKMIDRLVLDIQPFRNMVPEEIVEVLADFDKRQEGSLANIGLVNSEVNSKLSEILKIARETYPGLHMPKPDVFLMERLYNSLDQYEEGKVSPKATRRRFED